MAVKSSQGDRDDICTLWLRGDGLRLEEEKEEKLSLPWRKQDRRY